MYRPFLAMAVLGVLVTQTRADSVTFTVNLLNGTGDSPVPGLISYQSPIQDSNGDSWYETVLKITLNGSPYNQATFQVHYTALPTGYSVDIGDSSTENGGGGDSGTQSNDAETQITTEGTPSSGVVRVYGKDGTPSYSGLPLGFLAVAPAFVGGGTTTATITVRNNFVSWDNNQGNSGSLSSPYLYALAGQPDSEGPVNYDIYAAFNRVVDGPYRIGTGVGSVTVTLSGVAAVPEPSALVLLGMGAVGLLGYYAAWRRARRRE
jgi:hypothetical protein